jgi:hypothetical protein
MKTQTEIEIARTLEAYLAADPESAASETLFEKLATLTGSVDNAIALVESAADYSEE